MKNIEKNVNNAETEEELKLKKRKGAVRKAAVIFFICLLLLTFFSNTILNYTLPEVSTKGPTSGNVSTATVGQGTVEVAKTYTVKAKGNRVVDEVLVKKGDKVKKGDIILTYKKNSDEDLKAAKEELEDLEIQHAKELLKEDPDYSSENTTIERQKEDLKKAIEALDKAEEKKKELDKVEEEKKKVDKKLKKLNDELNQKKETLENTTEPQSVTDLQTSLATEQENLANATQSLADLKEDYEALKSSTYVDAAMLKNSERQIRDKEKEIANIQANINNLNISIEKAKKDTEAYKKLNDEIKELQDKIDDKTEKQSDLTNKISELSAKADVKSAKSSVESAQEALEDSVASLNKTKKTNELQEESDALDKEKEMKTLEEARKKVEKLTTDDLEQIVAKENGVVDTINTGNGKKVNKDDELIVITPKSTDNLIINIKVDKNAAKDIRKGMKANVVEDYDGSMKCKVKNITPDEAAPNEYTDIELSIKGKYVAVGDQYNVGIGGKSKRYDTVVSNNVIHEDNSGKFVYTVEVKSTPIGNRYKVKKVAVDIAANDGSRSAISGDLGDYPNLVSSSSKPLEDGMQVKLTDN